jgi:hypothetical protein
MSITVHVGSGAVKLVAPLTAQANAREYHVPDPPF